MTVGKLNKEGLTPSKYSQNDIIQFIPYKEMKKEQITIDIPEGMEAIQEETPDGLKIKFINKSLSYNDIENKLSLNTKLQTQYFWNLNVNECYFSKKIEVLRKLINIRNYFGKCDKTKNGYHICKDTNCYDYSYKFIVREFCICDPHEVVFAKKEHAEQAIKMLGDELKYLFEPW